MKTNRILTKIVAVGLFAAMTLGIHSASDASTSSANGVRAAVAAASPSIDPTDGMNSVNFTQQGDQFQAVGTDVTVSASTSAVGNVTVQAGGSAPLVVGLPDVQKQDGVLSSPSDTAVYAKDGDDVDVSVTAFDEGAQISTVIDSANAPTSYAFPVSVPTGGSIRLEGETVVILDSTDEPAGYIASPWARDVNGLSVPTHFELTGSVLTQVVEHTNSAYSYPIVADPFLGKDLVKSARWVWVKRSGSIGAGWTLEVAPTSWARFNNNPATSYYVGTLGWKELKKKYTKKGLRVNLGAMKDQFICHQQIVNLSAPRKPTWNLDEWRKNTSYRQTIRARCNPPRGGPAAY